MKLIKLVLVFVMTMTLLNVNAQEKKIKFNKGTLKICSSKNFQIEGYDGDEVIIESVHEKRNSDLKYMIKGAGTSKTYSYSETNNKKLIGMIGKKKAKELVIDSIDNKWNVQFGLNSVAYVDEKKDEKGKKNNKEDSTKNNISYSVSGTFSESDTDVNPKTVFFKKNDFKRESGLKRLGKKNKNIEDGIYFIIEERDGELIFKDDTEHSVIMSRNKERYKIKIPNSIKLDWQASECNKSGREANYFFFNSEKSSLSNFNGEVEISSSVHNVSLLDVTGPVSINTIGGNVTVKFDKKTPQKLYSIYSNNGFIDITLPKDANLKLDATASDIFSDIDFTVEQEDVKTNLQHMRLKLNKGSVHMKLNANLGNIYLRKK